MADLTPSIYFYAIAKLIFFIIPISLLLIICFLTFGRMAKSLGYSRPLWTIFSALAFKLNPLATFYLIGILPNRKLDSERKIRMKLLEEKIKKNHLKLMKQRQNVSSQTLSDESTLD